MKTMTMNRNCRTLRRPAYPNAADRRYYLRKLLDGLLAVATSVGMVVTIVFLLLL